MLGDEDTEFSVDAKDPETNIKYGTRYLKYLSEQFENDSVAVLAAYNAGLNNVKKWAGDDGKLDLEEIEYPETKQYVEKVLKTEENYKNIVHPLPVSELLFVGKATEETLHKIGVRTIGDLANADEALLIKFLGKRGHQLRVYARGEDKEPVKAQKDKEDLKSIGNSTTLAKDIADREEIKRWFYALAESVAARLRAADVGRANTVHIVVRNE
jgi:hypothetical protein